MRAPRNILLVEDEPTLQRILGSVLTDAGHKVIAVGTAEQALERVQDAPGDVDLVLTDKNLPAMNGIELLVALRQDNNVPKSLGVVLVTGYPSRDTALAALAADADGYLVKPFRSLAHAVDQLQGLLDTDLTRRHRGPPLARTVASLLAGLPEVLPATEAIVLTDDSAHKKAAEDLLTKAGAVLVGIDALAQPPTPGAAPLVVVAARVEDLVAAQVRRPGVAAVLLDAGAGFQEVLLLIGAGGGAMVDGALLLEGQP